MNKLFKKSASKNSFWGAESRFSGHKDGSQRQLMTQKEQGRPHWDLRGSRSVLVGPSKGNRMFFIICSGIIGHHSPKDRCTKRSYLCLIYSFIRLRLRYTTLIIHERTPCRVRGFPYLLLF